MQGISNWPAPAKALAGLFVFAAVAAIWNVLASTIFLGAIGMLDAKTIPFLQFYQYASYYGFSHPNCRPVAKGRCRRLDGVSDPDCSRCAASWRQAAGR